MLLDNNYLHRYFSWIAILHKIQSYILLFVYLVAMYTYVLVSFTTCVRKPIRKKFYSISIRFSV